MADDLGLNDTGYTGSDYYETPNIDKLSKDGMVFTTAYSSAANSDCRTVPERTETQNLL